MTQPYVYDAGVLIAADQDDRRVWARHKLAIAEERDVHVPAIVVGRAWRDSARQAQLARFVASCKVDPVGLETAKAAGVLCGRAGASDAVDATVAVMGIARRAVIWTADAPGIQRLVDRAGARPAPIVRSV